MKVILQLRFHLLIPSTGLTHIRLCWSYPASPFGFVIMVIIHTGCEQQVREINNAIAFLFVAPDSVVCHIVRPRGKSRARENPCIHAEIDGKSSWQTLIAPLASPSESRLRAYFKKSECSCYRDNIWNLPDISKVSPRASEATPVTSSLGMPGLRRQPPVRKARAHASILARAISLRAL